MLKFAIAYKGWGNNNLDISMRHFGLDTSRLFTCVVAAMRAKSTLV